MDQYRQKMSSLEKFKLAIPRIRDILRACSITGMDSMRHVCFYLLSRYITNDNVKLLGIPDNLSWENIFKKAFEDEDVSLQLFKVDLIDQFDKLFGTQQFSFEVKNGVKHKEILEILNPVQMIDVECHMDILGYVYEQHLKTGSTAARDLGQFFTDRFICEYMVKLCQPKFKYDGVPESVCDPTMGTGGFLTAYLKHFNGVDWSKHQNQIHGVDHDAKVSGVCRLNMFMESGGQIFKHLHTDDSLHGGLDPTTYDIILANMPFGLKGLKYKEVHQSIKNLHIDGTKSEPLFLQLMMVSLNKEGRCAVVVPDGMLVNNSKCHNGTRKHLVQNFELKRVVKMKGKFFMNTSIQPSILFFENSGKSTETVEFWDVDRDDKGNISEQLAISVPIEKFDESYSLDMRKYQETETVAYSDNVQMVTLDTIFKAIPGQNIDPDEVKDNPGPYEVVSGGKEPTKTYNKFNRNENQITVSKFGSYAGFVKWNTQKFWSLGSFTLENKDLEKYNSKYLYYYLSLNNDLFYNIQRKGPTTNFYWSDVVDIKVPVPPLEIQNQIVEELDTIYESKKNASEMIKNLNKQKGILAKNIDFRKYENIELQHLIIATKGKIQATKCDNGEWPVISISDKWRHSEYTEDGENVFVASTSRGTSSGPFETVVKYYNGKCAFTNLMHKLTIKNKEVISYKYLYYILQKIQTTIEHKCEKGTCNKTMDVDVFLHLKIPIPPLEVQTEIVKRLDELSEQIECLEKIESQTDENAKFVLDGYLGI
jgi:type I restriction-modification system DNA methylase subunit/restriction endonuclease S subunit